MNALVQENLQLREQGGRPRRGSEVQSWGASGSYRSYTL